ncbi:molybdenum cofactor guanylyltransferase [Chitiniphilus purpureus]|uniref:Molybdenum cofactor guanylyltransferase n=1 Tax=Chitiniphilus purpureus TaxID=2981137 RepID=A0ABY6DNC2_9NEIS|nr:molybdenum cofactor guanylyltransferase MobA [Chitiniphilus sp. CD1]UXY15859.1 molybdenum cofactor guanylyltransferase [Chitiniphilus sp. CD1]
MADVDALILCGGQGRRFGGQDKGLVPLAGRPLVQWVLAALAGWPVGQVLLSANRNAVRYRAFGHPVLPDLRSGFSGPLAGLEAGLAASAAPYLLVLPCDVPMLPADLLPRLLAALQDGAPVAYATDAQRVHPALCLVRRTERARIAARLDRGERGLARWQAAAGGCAVPFAFDFPNLNCAQTLAEFEQRRAFQAEP